MSVRPAPRFLSSVFAAFLATLAAINSASAQQSTADSAALRLLLARADSAWIRGEGSRDSAHVWYRELVARDSTLSSRAVYRLGVLESERNSLRESERLLRLYTRLEPADDAGLLTLARILSWEGKLDQAAEIYSSIVVRTASADARKGLARVTSWQGRLTESADLWRAVVHRNPRDVEAWIGLAQTERWRGNPGVAENALRQALDVDPHSDEAHEEMRWVQADLARTVEPGIVHTLDSDKNQSTSYSTTFVSEPLAGGAARLRIGGSFRDARYLGSSATSTTARASLVWFSPDRSVSATAEAGAARLARNGDIGVPIGVSRMRATAGLRAVAALSSRIRIGAGVNHSPIDETVALIAKGVFSTSFDGEATASLPRGINVGIAGSRARIKGDVSNSRLAFNGFVRWGAFPHLSVGASARSMSFDIPAAGDGYFSPDFFSLFEGTARLTLGRALGWGAVIEGGVGEQRIRMTPDQPARGNTAMRITTMLRIRPAPGFEYELGYGASSVASPFASEPAEYSATFVILRGRITL